MGNAIRGLDIKFDNLTFYDIKKVDLESELKFDLIIDDIVEQDQKQKLTLFIEKWIKEKISIILKSLIDLKNLNIFSKRF